MIQEHVRSSVATADADAWLVDGFGQAHALASRSMTGRSYDSQIVVLSGSVSREHAELRCTEDGWIVRDMGSHNGVFVDGVQIKGRATLTGRAILKLGDVAMWFLPEVAGSPAESQGMQTLDASGGMVNYLLLPERGPELRLIGNAEGGALMKGGQEPDERRLPQVEFQLLRILCVRAVAESSSPSATRGCVSTSELANNLPFQTRYANDENVRQAVRRLRVALVEMDILGLIAVHPGRGYFIACPVRPA